MTSIMLREIQLSDTENIIKWRNSDSVRQQFLRRNDLTEAEHVDWMESQVMIGKATQFIIVADGKDVGSVYLRDIEPETRKAEFGIYIGDASSRGHGIGKAAALQAIRHGFESLGLHKIFLRVLASNERALSLYTKLGFVQEGFFHDEMLIDGRYADIIFMALFNPEEADS